MNKKVIIIGISIIIAFIIILSIVFLKNKNEDVPQSSTVLDIFQVFELDDIEKSEYEINKSEEEQTASKYTTDKNIYKLNAKVEFFEKIGKMIYIRENYCKVNIFQTEYQIHKYESIDMQVEGIINNFENMCKKYLQIDNDIEPPEEILYGEELSKAKRPLGESIYYENRLYSKTYVIEDKSYDINFYKNEEKIICEFAISKDE